MPVLPRSSGALLLLLTPCVTGHGSGVWTDPKHYRADSLAGLRVISESPSHVLNVLGTDDGTTWWSAKGACSGQSMTQISLDLSPKGGPIDVKGTWAPTDDGGQRIIFADGNAWSLLMRPTPAFARQDGVDDHVGLFVDPRHYVDADSWAGLRFIAESPPHVLAMVGSDDGDVCQLQRCRL